jgi:glycerol-3-phosphate dehydrogenase (NAD(P)+)
VNKIAVLGAGRWGEALHSAFLANKESSFIGSRTKRDIKNFISTKEIIDSFEYIVLAISAQHIREWMSENFVFKNQKILVAAKGIEVDSGKFLNEVLSEFIPEDNLAFLTGPSFAAEVIQSLPTALVVNSTNLDLAKEFTTFFPNFIKTYVSGDVIGAEISGAYKNVIAIASGICDGLSLGNNARAALITRGLVEMDRFGEYFGAKKDTFLGLSGAGDLFLTASSRLSRNYRVGFELAKNKSLEVILKEIGEVAEGVYTSKAIYNISKNRDIYTPIADEVYSVIGGKDPKDSLRDLLK